MGLTWNCSLKCPVCARTGSIESNLDNILEKKSLEWKKYKNLIDHSTLYNFLFCGNYGDPIYYKNLLELCTYIKQKPSKIAIYTNGSYKTKSFWNQLSTILTPHDEIVFSIDGTLSSSHLYRINSNTRSILNGLDAITKTENRPELVWKHVVFPYNIDKLERAMFQALSLGFDRICFVKCLPTPLEDYAIEFDDENIKKRLLNCLLGIYDVFDISMREGEGWIEVELKCLRNV